MKAYIKIDATKPPEDDDDYITDHGQLQYSPDDEVWSGKIDDYWETFTPSWYLLEVSLSELMIEYAEFISENNWFKSSDDLFYEKSDGKLGGGISAAELVNIFLTQKGYIIKD